MCIAVGTRPSDFIVRQNQKDGLKQTIGISTFHYKEVKGQQTQIKRRVKEEHEDAERMAHDCEEKVKKNPKFDAHRDNFIEMMNKIDFM